MARGRPGLGVGHVDRLLGDEESKERLRVILRTTAGELTVEEACARLGIGESRFHEIRQAALQAALLALEVGPPGAPAPSLRRSPGECGSSRRRWRSSGRSSSCSGSARRSR
jgi:hypothetical protein